MSKSPITCHVLDSTLGKPAQGVGVVLEQLVSGSSQANVLAKGETDHDGRCLSLLQPSTKLSSGNYKMKFETGPYFENSQRPTFYPQVEILFTIPDPPDAHYHIPLLLSPYSYTTYRGS